MQRSSCLKHHNTSKRLRSSVLRCGHIPRRVRPHASRGKYIRAEPIASLYEQARVHHCGLFPELEDQMTAFAPDLERSKMGSPDRVDALDWAMTELLVEQGPVFWAHRVSRG